MKMEVCVADERRLLLQGLHLLAEANTIVGKFAGKRRSVMGATDPRLVELIVRTISPVLHGFTSEIQGAVLADLVATRLTGHVGPDAAAYREELLEQHIKTVRELIPINEKIVLERMEAEGNA
jgi:hypothetical protein